MGKELILLAWCSIVGVGNGIIDLFVKSQQTWSLDGQCARIPRGYPGHHQPKTRFLASVCDSLAHKRVVWLVSSLGFIVNLTQSKVTWVEGASVKELLPCSGLQP